MLIDTTEVQDINSFSRLESLKEVYGIIWMLVPIFTPVLGITIGVLVIVWLEREVSAGIQQRIGPEYASPLGILQALADRDFLSAKEHDITSKYVFVAKNWEALVSFINFVLYVDFHT
ncbi:hypothetical protein Patl1_25773 [Pistacia atlantica]|uniref:Uncharacterized protein n=1 Tax=Pistacia atlantica TaxID=434234 RepID=A0ACC1AZ18_9ROSI|nr:hypothetical protein Patl1_25773 [Pistacia atlantica]